MFNIVIPPYVDFFPTDGVTLNYVFPFELLQAEDLAVYFTAAGQPYDPVGDLIPAGEYSVVINPAPLIGGSITFTTAPAAGGTLVLIREMADELDTDFAAVETISGKALDNAFHRLLLLIQQNSFEANSLALHYPVNAPGILDDLTQVAVLEDGQYWKRLGDRIVGVTPVPGDEDTLRSELASQLSGGDGASLVGIYDKTNNVGETTSVAVNKLIAKVEQMWDNRPLLATVEFGHFTEGKPGWLLVTNYGTIGGQNSAATLLASDTAEALFTHYWEHFDNFTCPVPEGRGATSELDWAAGKSIYIPNFIGRAIAVAGEIFYNQKVIPEFSQSIFGVFSQNPAYETGLAVRLYAAGPGAALPTGISSTTTYYIIVVNSTEVKLASSPLNAQNNVPVTFTDNGTGDIFIKVYFENNPSLGQFLGYEKHSLTVDEGPYHDHAGVPAIYPPDAAVIGGGVPVANDFENSVRTQFSGNAQPHTNMQPTAYFNAQIYLGYVEPT